MSKILERLAKRKADLEVYYKRLLKQAETNQLGGEEDRLWLEQLAIGKGLDICTGDFLIGDSVGIDMDQAKIGANFFLVSGDKLTQLDDNSVDYIVCNYLDTFADPMSVLRSWHRVLKPKGVLGLVVRNAEVYDNVLGPLENKHRLSLFSEKIIYFYLKRIGFEIDDIEIWNTSLRVKSIK